MANPTEEITVEGEGEGEDDSSMELGIFDDEGESTGKTVGESEEATPNANNLGESSYTYEVVDSRHLDFDLSPAEEEVIFDDSGDEELIEEEYEEEVVVDDEAHVKNPDEANSPKQVQFKGFPDERKSSVQKTPAEEREISEPSDELDSEILAAAVLKQTEVVKESSDPVPGGEQQKENEQKGNESWDETEEGKQPGIDPATGVKHAEEPAGSKLATEVRQPQYDEYYSKLKGEEEYDVEEEDESDESEFTEPVPEVVHSTADENEEYSSYDEAHEFEFDASDSEDGQGENLVNETYVENIEEVEAENIEEVEAELEGSNAQSFAEDTGSEDGEPMPQRQDRSFMDGLDGESHEQYMSSQPQDSGNVMTGNLLDNEHHDPEMKLQPRRASKSSFGGGSFFDDDEAEAEKSVEMKDRRKYCIPILFLVICTLAAIATVLSIIGTRDGKQLSSRVVDLNSTQSPSFLRSPSPSDPNDGDVISPPSPTPAPGPPVTPRPPDNDVCLAATGVLPNDVPVDGTLFLAGGDNLDQCQTVPSGGLGVWYFVIGTGGEMLAHTCNENTAFDTKITIFTGSCAKPECVEADDDFCGRQSAVSWISSIQQTYWILVHGNVEADGLDPSFQLSVLTRFNDECSIAVGPVKIGDDNPPVIGDTRPATVNALTCGERVNDSPSVWYRVRGTGAEMTVNVCEGPSPLFVGRISLFTGICSNLQCFAQSDGGCVLKWQSTPFRTYYIMISGLASTSTGVFGLKVTSAPAPENDSCLEALGPLPADGVAIPGSTVGTAVQITAPQCEVTSTGPGIWYFVEGDGSLLQASLCGFATGYDTKISIYSGDCSNGGTAGDNLFCVGGNDDFCGLQSLVTWQTVAGTKYYILVHGDLLTSGSFEMTLERV